MLDRNRPYGIVYGNAGHAFEQDGKKFDSQGREIRDLPSEPGSEPKKDERTRRPVRRTA
jgi:hypothetical protein